jgi:hypothetical protein
MLRRNIDSGLHADDDNSAKFFIVCASSWSQALSFSIKEKVAVPGGIILTHPPDAFVEKKRDPIRFHDVVRFG